MKDVYSCKIELLLDFSTCLYQMYKIKSNRIVQSHYVIFITKVGLLMFTSLKFQFRTYYLFIYPSDLIFVEALLALYSYDYTIVGFKHFYNYIKINVCIY